MCVGVHIGRFKIPVRVRVHIYVTYRGGVAHAPPYSGMDMGVCGRDARLCYWNVILFIDIGDDTQGKMPCFHGVTGKRAQCGYSCL